MLSIRLKKQISTNVADTTFKGLDGSDSENRGQGYKGNKKIGGIRYLWVQPPPLPPTIRKSGSSTYPKLMEIGVGWGCLKLFARKGGGRQNGGALSGK